MSTPAVFLDRDGTLVHARHYPSRPDDLVLYEGIGSRLRSLKDAGHRLVVVTNQSGVARGYFTPADLDLMHQRLSDELGHDQVSLDGIYYCPHHPDGEIPELAVRCACRKPEPGLIYQAAGDLNVDLSQSWLVGDILGDVEAGNRAGCTTILVDLGTEAPPAGPVRSPDFAARDTCHALDIILAHTDAGQGVGVELDYLPRAWRSAPVAGMHA